MNPDVIYGRDFEEESMEIEKIDGPIGEVVIRGKILSVDTREIRNEKTIIIFSVTDFTDTIVLKIFARNDDVPELLKEISGESLCVSKVLQPLINSTVNLPSVLSSESRNAPILQRSVWIPA